MQIYDVSNTIYTGMVKWPDNPPVNVARTLSIEAGDAANVSKLDKGVHTGTHVDAPIHFVPGGTGADTLDLNVLVGPALVVHLGDDVADITAEVLDAQGIPAGTERILFRTRNSHYWANDDAEFHPDYVSVQPSAATWLVVHGVRLV